jgi:serine/threonine protein kinase/serine phosphatase RsbU (regulator of sigma subunit)
MPFIEQDQKFIQLHLEKYKYLSFIAEGSHGRVHLVEFQNKKYALKILKNKLDQNSLIQFRKEISSLACVRHSNIAEVFDSGMINDVAYIITEYAEGQSLTELISSKKISLIEALKLIKEVSLALDELHKLSFVHRDLKPSNLLVDKLGNVKLIDFGLIFRSSINQKKESDFVGSLRYASPEQLLIIKTGIDLRSDLYSLGLILYECLTFESYIKENDIQNVISSYLKKQLPLLPDTIPQGVRRLFEKLSALDPIDRYSTVQEILGDIDLLIKNPHQSLDIEQQKLLLPNAQIVGRNEELEALRDQWNQLISGKSQVAIVSGSSGMGKSSLVQAFVNDISSAHSDIIFFKGKFQEVDSNPLGAFSQAMDFFLDSIFKNQNSKDHHFRKVLIEAAGDYPSILFRLSKKLRLLFEDSGLNSKSFEVADDQLAFIIADYFVKICKHLNKKVIFILDDIQWASYQSQLIIQRLISGFEKLNSFLVMTSRADLSNSQEYIKKLKEDNNKNLLHIELKSLSDDALIDISKIFLGGRNLPQQLENKILDIASGNPFAAEQFTKFLIDSGALYFEKGHWALDEVIYNQVSLPNNLSDLLLARINKLEANTKHILIYSSLLGSRFSQDKLKKLIALNEEEFSRSLSQLLQEGLLSLNNENILSFVHDQILFSAQAMMDAQSIRNVHAHIADILIEAFENSSLEIAHHLYQADDAKDLNLRFKWIAQGAFEAFSSNANEIAIKYFEFCHQNLQKVDIEGRKAVDLIYHHGLISRKMNQHQLALNLFDQALNICDDPYYRVRIRSEIINFNLIVDLNLKKAEEDLRKSYEEVNEVFFVNNFVLFLNIAKYIFKILYINYFSSTKKISNQEIERAKSLALIDRLIVYFEYFSGRSGAKVYIVPRAYYIAKILSPSKESIYNFSLFLLLFGLLKKRNWIHRFKSYLKSLVQEIQDPFLLSPIESNLVISLYMGGYPQESAKEFSRVVTENRKWILPEDYFKMVNNLCLNLSLRGKGEELKKILSIAKEQVEALNIDIRKAIINGFDQVSSILSGDHYHANVKFKDLVNDSLLKQSVAGPVYIFSVLWYHVLSRKTDDFTNRVIELYYSLGWNPRNVVFHQRPVYIAIAYLRLYDCQANPKSLEIKNNFQKAFSDLNKISKSPDVKMHYLLIQARLSLIDQKYNSAIKYAKKAISLAEKIEAELGKFLGYELLAEINLAQDKKTLAKSNAIFAANLAEDLNWRFFADELTKKFALQSTQNRYQEADQQEFKSTVDSSKFADSLIKISTEMSKVLDPQKQAEIAMDEMIQLLGAERAFLFSYDKQKSTLRVTAGRNDQGNNILDVTGYSQTIIDRVLKMRQPIIVMADENGEFSQTESIVAKGLKSIMAIPLFFKEQFTGICYFDNQISKGLFSDEDFEICKGICSHISVAQEMASNAKISAEKASFEKDLALTSVVQNMFFPENSSVEEKHISMYGVYKPSSLCSGDWWWYGRTRTGNIRVFSIDVTGHGAPSAMVTAILATLIRSDLVDGVFLSDRLEDFINQMSQYLYSMIQGKFCSTLTAFEVNPITGQLDVWSAASPPIVIIKANGEKQLIEVPGELIGFEDRAIEIGHQTFHLQAGDRLYVFSDGLIEIPVKANANYSLRKFVNILYQQKNNEIQNAVENILTEVNQFVGDPKKSDDMTLIALDFKAS